MPKAIVCEAYGPLENLRLQDVPSVPPGPGEVRVTVKAAGVNYPDALIVEGKHQSKPALPFSPGSEAAGVVAETGAAVSRFRAGDRVIVRLGPGAFREEVTVPESRLIRMPDGADFAAAAGFLTAYCTSYYALIDLARLKVGETVLVLGAAGGVGLAAMDIARMVGAKVIAAASSPEKLEVCRQYGAAHLVNYESEDLRARLKEVAPDGVDVVYDAVGGRFAEPALRALAWEGRYLVIGFASGEVPKLPLNIALVKGAAIHGVWWGEVAKRSPDRAAAVVDALVEALGAKRLRPKIGGTYRLDQAVEALREIMERRAIGKLILSME